jgi:hypothetical protein
MEKGLAAPRANTAVCHCSASSVGVAQVLLEPGFAIVRRRTTTVQANNRALAASVIATTAGCFNCRSTLMA